MKGAKNAKKALPAFIREDRIPIQYLAMRPRGWGKGPKRGGRIFLFLLLLMPLMTLTGNSFPKVQSHLRSSSSQFTGQSPTRRASPPARLSASFVPHPLININGNSDFVAQATADKWAGDGSPTSPYVIEGFNITVGDLFQSRIRIRNTDVFFRIRNCWLEGGSYGIYLDNITNVRVYSNTITNTFSGGIYLGFPSNSTISGNTLRNSGNMGIEVYSSENITVTSNTITNNRWSGISLISSRNSTISNNSVNKIDDNGINLEASGNITISSNAVTNSGESGISLISSGNNTISGNYLVNNSGNGVYLSSSRNNRIRDNILVNNGIVVDGPTLEDYLQTEVANNTVNSKPLIYWQHATGGVVPDGVGQVILVNCTAVTVANQALSNASIGVLAAHSSSLLIQDNVISKSSRAGISFWTSVNNTVSSNLLSNNQEMGIALRFSRSSTVSGNTVTNHSEIGIYLESTVSSTLSENIVTNLNGTGIYLDSSRDNTISTNTLTNNSGWGIYIDYSRNTTLSANTVTSNGFNGIYLSASGISTISNNLVTKSGREGILLATSVDGTLSGNILSDNGDAGIFLWSSASSTISGNTFSNNVKAGIFLWDTGASRIVDNILVNNGLTVDGTALEDYLQTEVANNTVNSKPLIYWQHATGGVVPDGVGQVILVNCTAVTVANQSLSNMSIGVLAAYSSNLSIHNNQIFNNSGYGVSLIKAENVTVERNDFIDNNPNGTSQANDDGINNIFAYNYWNEWTEPDSNGDGLVDLPYPIDGGANNQDLSPRTLPMQGSASSLPDQLLITLVLVVSILGALSISVWVQRRG